VTRAVRAAWCRAGAHCSVQSLRARLRIGCAGGGHAFACTGARPAQPLLPPEAWAGGAGGRCVRRLAGGAGGAGGRCVRRLKGGAGVAGGRCRREVRDDGPGQAHRPSHLPHLIPASPLSGTAAALTATTRIAHCPSDGRLSSVRCCGGRRHGPRQRSLKRSCFPCRPRRPTAEPW
jgi:hypothetical protein